MKDSGRYNPEEKAPTIWRHLQDIRLPLGKDADVQDGQGWAISGKTNMEVD